jgi:hypothetical protein
MNKPQMPTTTSWIIELNGLGRPGKPRAPEEVPLPQAGQSSHPSRELSRSPEAADISEDLRLLRTLAETTHRNLVGSLRCKKLS